MLYKACFSTKAINQGNMPSGYIWGDVLIVNTVRLKPKFRGYGIGLLALDTLVKHAARLSPEWKTEGLIALAPSALTQDMVDPASHEKVQDKLVRYYKLFGLKMLAEEMRKHCAFVGQWMGYSGPKIRMVVPHLFQ